MNDVTFLKGCQLVSDNTWNSVKEDPWVIIILKISLKSFVAFSLPEKTYILIVSRNFSLPTWKRRSQILTFGDLNQVKPCDLLKSPVIYVCAAVNWHLFYCRCCCWRWVNFTNIICTAFTCADPKSAKRQSSQSAFCAFGTARVKAARKMLVKLTWCV